MGKLSNVYANLLTNLGLKADAALSVGSVNAKLAQLLARIESVALFEGTTGVTIQCPVATASPAQVTGGNPAWTTWGAWTELAAAGVLTGHMLTAVHGIMLNVNAYFQYEIGVGGAGAEVSIFKSVFYGAGTYPDSAPLPVHPAVRITANARLAIRAKTSNAANNFYCYVFCQPRPI